MAANEAQSKASTRDESSDAANSSDSDNNGDTDAGEPEQQVEWLATSRAKRSTAGNRLKAMLANEKPAVADDDSDLELLFASDEEDAGFTDEGKDDASDVLMDSSSDDEDNATGAGADELEGEKELERQAREKRTKRKAQKDIPVKFRKKVRIEQPPTAGGSASPRSTTPMAPKPRPKKKSERASWLPSADDRPVRASDRQTTRTSKQQLHKKMVEDEIKRKKQVERMEKGQQRREAAKKPPMTQAERLNEAALVEKRNSKSLNRWEVAEKQREEERLRKIAALNNRKLDGPVVTFWSAIQTLEEGQQKHVGNLVSIEEKAPRKKRQPKEPKPVAGGSEPPTRIATADAKPADAVLGPEIKPETVEPSAQSPATTSTSNATPQQPLLQTKPLDPSSSNQPSTAETNGHLAQISPPTAATPTTTVTILTVTTATVPAATITTSNVTSNVTTVAAVSTPASISLPPASSPLDAKQPSAVLAAPVLAAPFGTSPAMFGVQVPMMGVNGKSNVLAHPNTSQGATPFSVPAPAPIANGPTIPKLQTPASLSSALTAYQLESNTVVPNSLPPPQTKPQNSAPTVSPAPQPAAPGPAVSTTATTPSTLPAPPPLPIPLPLQPSQVNKSQPSPITPATPQDGSGKSTLEGKVTRSCIILQNFDENAIKDRQVQTQILFGRKMNKLAKPAHAPLCVITNHPARYRDPKTGLPYYNTYAYREIQRVYRGDYKFSRLLGTYVGSGNIAASGVPERFLDPTKKRTTRPKSPEPILVPKDDVLLESKDSKDKEEKKPATTTPPPPPLPPLAHAEPKLEPDDSVKGGVAAEISPSPSPPVPVPVPAPQLIESTPP
ncbi:YL1 nuclear protein-domain-containing protein [Podospora didyma]|uniref:YL1 nuclear protein-domain-containing protein n=1 Tax=Podospora didyma TaxID=330526 RepID=A0AAE0KEX4_9PEZI|nr:YL1 nuclear protein-domain-containing protein [Podospora didyma]